jgi:hypothetical protein
MLNNPTFKKYQSSVTDLEMYGVRDINAWYEAQTQYRVTASELVMGLSSDIQWLTCDPAMTKSICLLSNRIKWLVNNKLTNR